MIPVPKFTEITNDLWVGLPANIRASQEQFVVSPTVNRFYLTPVVIAASSWRAALQPPAELADAITADIHDSYPQRVDVEGCDDVGRVDRSGAAGRRLSHFDWETNGGRLVRSHLTIFTGTSGEVAVMHLTVPQRLADDTISVVGQIIDSARFQPDRGELSTDQLEPVVVPGFSQGVTP